jgi:hypothetical protein
MRLRIAAVITLGPLLSFSAHSAEEVRKYAGDLSLSPPAELAPEETIPGLAKPTVRWAVRLKANGALPESLRDRLPEGISFAPSESVSFYTLENPTLEELQTAINDEGVQFLEMQPPPDFGDAFPPVVNNREAATSHRVNEFRDNFGAQGGSRVVGVFDEGRVRHTHQEFRLVPAGSRVENLAANSVDLSFHSTHVAGSVGAKGVNGIAKGMAPEVRIRSYTWDNDLNVLDAESSLIQFSNHSYGPQAGWAFDDQFGWIWFGRPDLGPESSKEDSQFGKYSDRNANLDGLLFREQKLAVFVAAGNDRSDAPPFQPIQHWALGPVAGGGLGFQFVSDQHLNDGHNGDGVGGPASVDNDNNGVSPDSADPNNNDAGFDTIAGLGLSKNVICIGAVHDITSSLSPIRSTLFSSWGPTDDGRIKPDLVANGQKLFSTGIADDGAYGNSSGTSMSSPVACGCGALISEFYKTKKGADLTAPTLKAILIHTARDAGRRGPDYVFGWGSIDAFSAGRLIEGSDGQIIKQGIIVPKNDIHEMQLKPSSSVSPVRVTVVWNDPPAPANTGNLDDPFKTLRNDINIELHSPDGVIFRPYILDPANPATPATTGNNERDNVEVIDAPTRSGEWTLRLVGTDFAEGDKQAASVVVSGLIED